jgi:SSS family solute:Na+ symporter
LRNSQLKLSFGLAILPLYFLVTIVIGWFANRQSRGSSSYLNASRSLPLWIVTAAYLAANCGALEIVGLSAMAAQYGVQAFNFYWIGAIPAMVFLAIWMMPVYRRSGVKTLPEYLAIRYGPGVRLLNAIVLAVTMLLLGGISLYAMAQVLEVVVGLSFAESSSLSAAVVLVYVLMGGIRATIYNEVFQLMVMVAGLVPLAVRSIHVLAAPATIPSASRYHLWTGMPLASQAAPVDSIGVVFGLGFVLSFAYWCTDFVLMQRAFAARTETEARQVPLWAGFGKLAFSLLVILPGLAAYRLIPALGSSARFDQALPALMNLLYGPTMLGIGLTALVASLMSGLAANVSGFAAVWTEDIYRAYIRKHEQDSHYLLVARISAIAAILACTAASYIDFLFRDLMEHVQMIFSIFGAPFWAVFLLGMSTRRTTARGAVAGFLTGTTVGLLHLAAFTHGWIRYGSIMNANFHAAIYSFSTAAAVGLLASFGPRQRQTAVAGNLIFNWRMGTEGVRVGFIWSLALILLVACAALNFLWR